MSLRVHPLAALVYMLTLNGSWYKLLLSIDSLSSIDTLKLLFSRLSIPNPSEYCVCCRALSTAAVLVRLFFVTMNNITAISTKMIMASAVITTLMICCSGSWSIGRDETTVMDRKKFLCKEGKIWDKFFRKDGGFFGWKVLCVVKKSPWNDFC